MDAYERELLLRNPFIKLMLHHGGPAPVAAEAVVSRELALDAPSDEALREAERAMNAVLAKVDDGPQLRQLFSDSVDVKGLGDIFVSTVNEFARLSAGSKEAKVLELSHPWSWYWEREVLAYRRFLESGKQNYDLQPQQPAFFRAGVQPRTFWTLDELGPAFRTLEENAPKIRAELEQVYDDGAWLPYRGFRGARDDVPQLEESDSDWNAFFFYHPFRGRFAANHARCPVTSKVLESLPGLCRRELALFSALQPGAVIPAHCGPFNGRVRVHLALTGSKGCYLRVGTQIREWQDGRVLAFDDATEHQVCHNGSELRVVLMFVVLQPGLEPSVVDRVSQVPADEFVASDEERATADALSKTKWWK